MGVRGVSPEGGGGSGRIRLGIFFFSSRRRHTRYWPDWSSDVCSSDLAIDQQDAAAYPSADPPPGEAEGGIPGIPIPSLRELCRRIFQEVHGRKPSAVYQAVQDGPGEIGRASCRERV